MPIKRNGRGADPQFHEWRGGFTWIAHPEEAMERASQVLAVSPDGAVADRDAEPAAVDLWIVDPVDAVGVDDRIADRGRVAGVVVLSGYHSRDATAFARRYGVPVFLPEPLAPLESGLGADAETFAGQLPGTAYSVVPVRSWPGWREAALHEPDSGTLVVAESLVRQAAGTAPDEEVAVAPYLRLWPPRAVFAGRQVNRLLVGHGDPMLEEAGAAIEAALANARFGTPSYLRHNLGYLLKAWSVAIRT
jgi:hypothetical protein